MIENKLHFFFKNQIWHIGGLIVLYYVALQMVDFETDSNVFLGISSKNWFLFSMLTPLLASRLCLVMLEVRIMLENNQQNDWLQRLRFNFFHSCDFKIIFVLDYVLLIMELGLLQGG